MRWRSVIHHSFHNLDLFGLLHWLMHSRYFFCMATLLLAQGLFFMLVLCLWVFFLFSIRLGVSFQINIRCLLVFLSLYTLTFILFSFSHCYWFIFFPFSLFLSSLLRFFAFSLFRFFDFSIFLVAFSLFPLLCMVFYYLSFFFLITIWGIFSWISGCSYIRSNQK